MKAKKGLSHSMLRTIDKDHRKAAKTAQLTYVTNSTDGFSRHKRGKSFSYKKGNKLITNSQHLERIKKLAIPPSWTEVWICASPNGHIQATGIDLNGRKQYRYHAKWNELRNETKFHRMLDFGKVLPQVRKRIKKDISIKDMTAEKVVATAIRLMEQTYIRIGNNGYEKLYGSYGITTLKDRHVSIQKDRASFSFTGKKGIDHEITLKDKQLARILKQCRDIPGKELFQYYDIEGNRKGIDSGMVNSYIKEASGDDFSAKDFRTWAGSLQALECFCVAKKPESAAEVQKTILNVLDEVSAKLGNSRNICKKYYVHPGLINLYEENKLMSFLDNGHSFNSYNRTGLSGSEKILMRILKKCA